MRVQDLVTIRENKKDKSIENMNHLFKRAFIIIALLVCLFFVFCPVFVFFSGQKVIKNKRETVATLINIVPGKNSYNGKYEYFANGKKYERWGSSFNTLVIGDKFILEYNDKKAGETKLCLARPVFEIGESVVRTEAIIKKKHKRFIEFEYVFENIKYTRFQDLPADFEDKYQPIEKGKSYTIDLWKDNPQRAIIYLDKPLF